MKNLTLILIAMLLSMFVLNPVMAQEPPAEQPSAIAADPAPAPDTTGDIVTTMKEVAGLITAIKALIPIEGSTRGEWVLAICMMLSLFFKFLMDGLKRFARFIGESKIWMKVTPLILGLLVLIIDRIVGGGTWWESIALLMSGPGAIAVNELWKIFFPKKVIA